MRSKTDIYPRISAVAEYIERGESTDTILNDFTERWTVAKRTVEWYITLAKQLVAERGKTKDAIVQQVRNEAIATIARGQIMSDLELESILCSIARGEPAEHKVVFKDKTKKVMIAPSFFDRVMAIDKLWKKRGSYPDDKKQGENKTYVVQYNIQKQSDIEHIENT